MEREFTPREQTLIDLAREQFGDGAKFTYVNREARKVVTLTLDEALDVCAYIVDASDEDVLNTLGEMHTRTQQLVAARQARIAQQAIGESQV